MADAAGCIHMYLRGLISGPNSAPPDLMQAVGCLNWGTAGGAPHSAAPSHMAAVFLGGGPTVLPHHRLACDCVT